MTGEALHDSTPAGVLRELIGAELRTIAMRLDGMRELHSERFSSVDREFVAMKQATIEMRGAFTKQIDSISAMIGSQMQNADGKISDLKDRLTAIESGASGGHLVRTERRLDAGMVVNLIMAGIMGGSLLLSVVSYAALRDRQAPQATYQPAPAASRATP